MKKLIFIPLLFYVLSVHADIYWVTPRGNNSNSGADSSSTGAWLTWAKAFATANAGDTVYIRGGNYNATVLTGYGLQFTNNGSAGNFIRIEAYPADYAAGKRPVLDCSASNITPTGENDGIRMINRDYIHLKGLEIKNLWLPTGSGVQAHGINCYYADSCIFENLVLHDIENLGIGLYMVNSAKVINCDAYNCGNIHKSGNPGDNGTGIASYSTNTDGWCYIYGCRAWNCTDNGFSPAGSYSYVKFENCWAYDNGKVAGNTHGYGNGFKISYLGGATTITTSEFIKCIAAENLGAGFDGNDQYDYNRYCGNYNILNCFSYHNGDGLTNQYISPPNYIDEWGYILRNYAHATPGAGRILRNNISYDDYSGDFYCYGGTYTAEYNSWNTPPNISVNTSDFQSLYYTQLAGARKADGSLPDITFGRLASTSDCIDAGMDVGLSYDGAAPDLGWAEYEATSAEPVVLTITSVYAATTSASVNCNVIDDGGGTISARGVVWSTDANPDLTDNVVTVTGTTGAYVATISGLDQGTTYHVRAYATNEYGTSYDPSTGDTEFTTKTSGSGGVFRKYGVKFVFYNGKWIRL